MNENIESQMSKSGMTHDEQRCMNHLIEAINIFNRLPNKHPDEQEEFRHAMHRIQDLIAYRIVKRNFSEYWWNSPKGVN